MAGATSSLISPSGEIVEMMITIIIRNKFDFNFLIVIEYMKLVKILKFKYNLSSKLWTIN